METLKATVENLNDIMEFDFPIEVHENGSVTRASDDVWAPELYLDVDEDGQVDMDADEDLKRQAKNAGWELLTGYSGQHRYTGPVFHSSEYIGGRMASDILEIPGVFVAVTIETLSQNEDEETEPAGWVVAKKIA